MSLTGAGTYCEPFLIKKASDLLEIDKKSADGEFYHYLQTADIDLSTVVFQSIGTTQPFNGSYDGGCNKISNLYSRNPIVIGLFNECNEAELSNINLHNVDINLKHGMPVGALGSYFMGQKGKIDNCHIRGSVVGSSNTGMFFGVISISKENSFFMNKCNAEGSVEGVSSTGGIIGRGSRITGEFCYFKGDVNATRSSAAFAGSLNDCKFSNCFVEGSLTAQSLSVSGFSEAVSGCEFYRCFTNLITLAQGGSYSGFAGGASESEFTECATYGSITAGSDTWAFASRYGYEPNRYMDCYALIDTMEISSYALPSGDFDETEVLPTCYYNASMNFSPGDFLLNGNPTSEKDPFGIDVFNPSSAYRKKFTPSVCCPRSCAKCERIAINKLLGGY